MRLLAGYRRQPYEYLFQDDHGDQIAWGISYTFDRVVAELGLNDGVTDKRRRVRFHTLRHTFASWLAQSGQVTLHELMELMRHKRIEMTLRYAHLIPGGGRNKLRIIDQVLLDPEHDEQGPRPFARRFWVWDRVFGERSGWAAVRPGCPGI